MELNEMRSKFNDSIAAIITNKRVDNKAFLSSDEYNARLKAVKLSKNALQTAGAAKSVKDYRNVTRYDIQTIKGKERLIRPINCTKKIIYFATNEELFDILHSTHLTVAHGGRNRMFSELKKQYANITKETIMVYLRLCAQCQKKSSKSKCELVATPILHSSNSRAQIDFVDMQSHIHDNFRFIMIYQDYVTKFVQLKPLKTQHAQEIASILLEIYTIFGAPVILQSDNGQEFVNSIITELHSMWSELKIVHGKPSYNKQDSVECANREIVEMLAEWMSQNQSTDWPYGLKFIQFQKNCALHSGIGKSPYEAMFGCPARIDLQSSDISHNTEEDVKELMRVSQENSRSIKDELPLHTDEIKTEPTETNENVLVHEHMDIIEKTEILSDWFG